MITANKTVEEVFGTISLIVFTVQLVPQLVHTHRIHRQNQRNLLRVQSLDAEDVEDDNNGQLSVKFQDPLKGLSLMMPVLWFIGVIFQCAYFIHVNVSYGLIIQPHGFAFFSFLMILQWGYVSGGYQVQDFTSVLSPFWRLLGIKSSKTVSAEKSSELELTEDLTAIRDDDRPTEGQQFPIRDKRRMLKHVLYAFIIGSVYWILIEVGILYALRSDSGQPQPSSLVLFVTIFPSVLCCIGFLPAIFELFIFKSSAGLSLTFILMDLSGSILGVISLIFKHYPEGEYTTQFLLASLVFIMVAVGDSILLILWIIYRNKK
ncbi:hypothetical protein MIR68_009302 [Amoeboaphelidium protococcarum]|nr:hypothetical protein MIR68_009302 [Amoeboaphelidium protococcarum]